MAKAWRAEYDADLDSLVKSMESLNHNMADTISKLGANSPKDRYQNEQSSAYVHGLLVELPLVYEKVAEFAEKWDLILTKGGFERTIDGKWSDTP